MTEDEQAQGGAYGEQQAEFSDAEETRAGQATPSGSEEYGAAGGRVDRRPAER